MVLLGHGFGSAGITPLKNGEHFLAIQSAGVVILFILSGFLTTYSLDLKNRDHEYTFGKYVKQRAIRIYSGYIPALFFILLLDGINIIFYYNTYSYKTGFNVYNFVGDILMLQSTPFALRHDIIFGSGRPLWTLSLEWWNYMAYGMIWLIIANHLKMNFKKLFLLLVLALTPLAWLSMGNPNTTLCFLLGCFAYYIYDHIELKYTSVLIILNILFIIVYGICIKSAYFEIFYYMIFSLLILIMIYGKGINRGGGGATRNKVLSFMASYTYMLYLTHYSVFDFLENFKITPEAEFMLGVILSNVIAIVMYLLIEKPISKILRKYLV